MAGFSSSADTALNIARGLVSRTSGMHKFGAVPQMSNDTTGTVWDIDDTNYPWSSWTTAGTLTIPAVHANDDDHYVTIVGLDSNYDYLEETVIVSSSAPVTTTNSFIRVNRAFFTDGGQVTNTGIINIQKGGVNVARINADKAQTLMTVYTVPRGYNAYLTQGTCSIEYGGDCTIDMFVRFAGTSTFRIAHTGEVAGTGMPYKYEFTIPQKIPSMSDIDVRANVRSNNSRVTAAFDLILVQE